MSNNNISRSLTRIITYLLFAVLILGTVYGVLKLLNKTEGMYVVYGDTTLTSTNSGVNVDWTAAESGVTFSIANSDGWGAYSVDDCTVKIIPNVNDNYDFEFTVNGKTAAFSNEDDLTAAFVEDYTAYGGNGLAINSDGEFTLYMIAYTSDYLTAAMAEILSRVYGGVSVETGEIDLLAYPYLAISVISPDGSKTINIPFSLYVNDYYITYELTGATALDANVSKIVAGEGATLQFSAATGYVLPDEITVTGATLDNWNSATGTAIISNATNNVTVTVEALRSYSITYNLTNLTASEDNAATIAENSSVTLCFYADDGYSIPTDVTITNVSRYSWGVYSSGTGYITIYNPTGDVTITMSGVADETYTLSGVWIFDETLTSDGTGVNGDLYCSFTSNDKSYSYMIVAYGLGKNMLHIYYGSDEVFKLSSGWVDDVYRTIDFGDGQSVNQAVYEFITKYATQYVEETYTITISSDSYQYLYSSTISQSSMTADETVTISVKAKSDYQIYAIVADNATITVTSSSTGSGNSYSFTVSEPTDDVTITVMVIDA